MSKPKNPYNYLTETQNHQGWNYGYAAGLADGSKRERRAFTRLIDKLIGDHVIEEREAHDALYHWLASRQKEERKK